MSTIEALNIRLSFDGSDATRGLRLSQEELNRFAATAARAGAEAARGLQTSAQAAASQAGQWRELSSAAAEAGHSLGSATQGASAFSGALRGLGPALAIGAVIASVQSAARALIEAQQAADKLRESLTYSSGSAAAAAAEMDYLVRVTRDLGLDFSSTAAAYGKFAAATHNTGISAEQTRTIFEGVSQASTKMGLSAEETSGALFALSQMASKGVVSSEELRQQLAERLPGAMAIAAQAMGMTDQEFNKLLSTGQILANDFLPKFGQALKNEFGGAVNSLTQEVNRLNSAWDLWKQTVGADGGIFRWLTQGINESAAAMRALGRDSGVAARAVMAVGGFIRGSLGASHFDDAGRLQQLQDTQLPNIEKQMAPLLAKKRASAFGALNVIETNQLAELAATRRAIEGEIKDLQATLSQPIKAPALDPEAARFIAARDAKKARADAASKLGAYLDDTGNDTKAVKIAAKIEAENKAFQAATAGFAKNSEEYLSAVKAHERRVAEIQKSGASKSGGGGGGSAGLKNDQSQTYAALIAAEKDFTRTQVELIKSRVAQGLASEEQGIQEMLAVQLDGYVQQETLLKEQLAKTKDLGDRARLAERIQEVGNDYTLAAEKAAAAFAKIADARRKAMQESLAGFQADVTRIHQQNDALRDQLATLGMTTGQLAEYRAQKIDAAAAAESLAAENLREAATTAKAGGAAQEAIDYYRALADARTEAAQALSEEAALTRQVGAKTVAVDEAKKSAEAWKKFGDDLERGLTDSLYRAFEAGKGFGKTFVDSLKTLFKTTVMKFAVQATVSGGMESLGLGGAASGQTLSSAAGSLQNANSLLSGANNIWNVGTMIAGGYGALPGTVAASNVVGAFGGDSLGALIATNPQWSAAAASAAEGAVAASAAAEGAAAAAVAAEGAAATFGSAAAAAIPYVGWVVAAAGVLYSIFGGDGPGKSQGAAAYTSLSGGKIGPTDIGEGPADKYASGYQAPLNSLNTAFLGAIDALGSALGRQQSVNLTSAIKARGDGKQYGGLSYSINGGQQRDFSWAYDEGDQQATAKLAAKALSEVLVEAIKSSSFGDQITSLFDGLTSPESTLQMVQAVVALSKASEQLNATWGLTIDQAATVARLTADGTEQGRVAAAAALAQAAMAKKAISASLVEAYEAISEPFRAVVGSQLPLSLKAYDDALKAVDKSTHAGVEAFARLFALRGDFTAFVAAIDGLRTGVNNAIDGFRTPEDRIARRQSDLYAAVDEAGIALPASYSALVSLADSIDYTTEAGLHLALTLPAVIAAFKNLQEVAGPISEERKGLQEQLDALTLTSTQLLERQREALDASNRALFDQVQAATAAKRVTEERQGLQEQLDALTLTSVQLLERQREALDASNRALFDQVQAAIEARRVADERLGLQNQIDQALGDTAVLRQRELAALDPSNRALQLRIYALADEQAAREAAEQQKAADAAAAERARGELQSAYDQRVSAARSRLQEAYRAESSALETLADRLSNFAQAARSMLNELFTGESSPLSSAEQFSRAKSGLGGVISRAQAADSAALPELQSYLALSKENSATFVDYARDFAQVVDTLSDSATVAEAQAGLAKQQLAQLKKLTDGVLGVDSSVLSVAEAIAALNAVTEGGLLGVVEAVASAANSSAATIAAALASSRLPVSTTSIQTSVGQAAQPAYDNYTWQLAYPGAIWLEAYDDASKAVNQAMLSEHYGGRRVDDAYRAEIFRSYGVPGYAAGGDFAGGLRLVGENGPELEITGPSRLYSAGQTRQMLGGGDALIAEVRALRDEVAQLRAEARATAGYTGKTAKILDRVLPDGDALSVRIAS